ncbi:rhomboid protease GluP [Aneurinibacillus soli]|uniref:Rhomboid protease GluP n=1 Tax=Aneurinibacillus soli TaxID=1500254 RepID=A0A0U5B8T7_9BACL|nr:rhomboid family intramembrane serine protease [Aneurinibacillus soli]PYE63727.1 rhomboid protease GluP [Aneurinibacillus soli]BAU27340.1 Rhomboid protease GluP [Aneurinibacillus soli]
MKIAILHDYIGKTAYRLVAEQDYMLIGTEKDVFHLGRLRGRTYQYVQLRICDFVWSGMADYDRKEIAARLDGLRRQTGAQSVEGVIIYLIMQPVTDELQEAFAGGTIDEFSIVLTTAGYVPPVHKWLGEYAPVLEKLVDLAAFDHEPVQTDAHSTEYWVRTIQQWEQRRKQELQQVFSYGKPRVTYAILAVIIVIFLAMEALGGSQNEQVLVAFGAKYNPLILAGEWWRFVTPIFLHIGFMHILFNGVALYSLGAMTERLYGSGRFFVIFMLAGISGVVASFVFSTHMSAGASGALFGLFGALLYFGMQDRTMYKRVFGSNVLVLLGINLAIGLLSPGLIDNYAHLGGLCGGFLAAATVGMPGRRAQIGVRIAALTVLVLFLWLGMTSGGAPLDAALFR